MKKIYLLLSFVFAGTLVSFSQITLQQADLPVAGLAFTLATNDTSTVAIPAGGANQTWDLSLVLNNTDQDTIGFMAAAGTPFAAQVPSANLASFDPSTGNYAYFTASSTGFYNNGASDPSITGGFAELNPPQMFVPVPFTYTNSTSSDARMEVYTAYFDSSLGITVYLKIVHAVHSIFLADGWGTLILPNATHNNTLRIRVTDQVKDSIFVDLTGTGSYMLFADDSSQNMTYRWFGPGPASYLLGMEADSLGTTAIYTEYLLQHILLGTQDLSAQARVNAYPNPAADRITLQWDAIIHPVAVRITDVTGREVMSAFVQNLDRAEIPVGHLANGMYHYRLELDNGAVKTGQFSVSH